MRNVVRRKVTESTATSTSRAKLKRRYDEVEKAVIDYDMCIAQASQKALRDLQRNTSDPGPNSRLVSKGKITHFPRITLPKQLRRKHLVSDGNVFFGKHGGLLIKKELGRGTFGRVILVNATGTKSGGTTVAIKVQSPTHSLAWEFVVLQRLERRLSRRKKQTDHYPFPRSINFISLADGGILGMSTASETGLNLVDLSNFYKLKLGESVPELLALHYTSTALKIIEHLHSYGNILVRSPIRSCKTQNLNDMVLNFSLSSKHCDVKPDNFVLSKSNSPTSSFSNMNFSGLTLVDFGSAIDLELFPYPDNVEVLLCGSSARKDMQCVAMRCGRPWSYDADMYGVLCCAHVLLYGNHMELKNVRGKRWAPSFSLKRYWKRDLWTEIFETLLVSDDSTRLSIGPRGSTLQWLRQKIEAHLKVEERTLQELLSRQENILPDSRNKIE